MNIECGHCHQRILIRLQFLSGTRVEVECPICHELLKVDLDDIEKGRLEDTHPILRVAPEKPVHLRKEFRGQPENPSDADASLVQLLPIKRFFSTAISAFFILLVVVFFYWIRPKSKPSAPSVEPTPNPMMAQETLPPSSVMDEPPELESDLGSATSMKKRKLQNPSFSSRRGVSTLDQAYETLQPSLFAWVETSGFKVLTDHPMDPKAMQVAVVLAFDGYRTENALFLQAVEKASDRVESKLKNPDYNLVQALLKLNRTDFAQAYKFAENAYGLSRSKLSQAVMQYASWKISPSTVPLDKLRSLYATQNFFPAGDFLLQAYAADPKRYPEAIVLARGLLQKESRDIPIRMRLGSIFLEMKMYDEAVNVFEMMVRQDAGLVSAKLLLARSLRKRSQFDLARRILDALLKETNLTNVSPAKMVEIQLERGQVDLDAKRYGDAVRYFEVAHRSNTKNLSTLRLLTTALLESKREKTALSLLESLRTEYAGNHDFLLLWVSIQMAAKDYLGAEKNLLEMLSMSPSDTQGLLWLGEVREARGDRKSALEAYQKALALDANNPKAKAKILELASAPTS